MSLESTLRKAADYIVEVSGTVKLSFLKVYVAVHPRRERNEVDLDIDFRGWGDD